MSWVVGISSLWIHKWSRISTISVLILSWANGRWGSSQKRGQISLCRVFHFHLLEDFQVKKCFKHYTLCQQANNMICWRLFIKTKSHQHIRSGQYTRRQDKSGGNLSARRDCRLPFSYIPWRFAQIIGVNSIKL